MIWGEPEDKVSRAKDAAANELQGMQTSAGDLLVNATLSRVGINDQAWMLVGIVIPDVDVKETYISFPVESLAETPEDEIRERLKAWACTRVEKGYGPQKGRSQ